MGKVIHGPFFVRFWPECDFQVAAGCEFFMIEPGPVEGLAVEFRRLDVHVFTGIVFRGDLKRISLIVAVVEMDRHGVKYRAGDFVNGVLTACSLTENRPMDMSTLTPPICPWSSS